MHITNPQTASEVSLLESLSKLLALTLGLLYVTGFLVVAFYLSRYGASSVSVLQLQYLVAGTWVLGPPAAYGSLLHVERRFERRAAPETKGFNWRRFVMSTVLTGIPSGVFMVLLASIPGVFQGITWQIGLRLFSFFFAMVALSQLFWMSRQADPERETYWMNRRDAAPFYLASLMVTVLCYALWFSARIYPLIPFSLGGGKPLTVVFFEGEKRMPEELRKADQSARRSAPYKLLFATDRYFVVLSPSEKERSIEISRDSVSGMVVLDGD